MNIRYDRRIRAALKLRVLALAAGLTFTAPAFSAPIEITVPVQVQNMHPDVMAVFVSCYVFDESGSYLPGAARSGPYFIVEGMFTGDIVAKLEGDPSLADSAHSYLCYLSFSIRGVAGTHRAGPIPTIRWDPSEYVRERLQVAEGSQFVHYYEGSF